MQYEAVHYIVTALTWQDARKFFEAKYKDKKFTFAARAKLSTHKEGYINEKEHRRTVGA